MNKYNDKIKVLKSIKRYIKYINPQLPLVKSIKTIDTVLSTIKKTELERREREEKFPTPPIPGTKNIIPIKTKRELNYWSKRQINCIHDYVKSIKRNKNYFYKVVLDNEEASLQLVFNKDKIKIGSLLATRNKDVSFELKEIVDKWIKKNI